MSEKIIVDSASLRTNQDDFATQPNLQRQIAQLVYPYSHSPWPVWSLSALFAATSMAGSNPALPPLFHRLGFSAIFGGAGYMLYSGDIQNGTGTTTAWSAIYLLSTQIRKLAAKKDNSVSRSLKHPRHPLGFVLAGASFLSTAVYGGEYFWFQNFNKKQW